ncbi:MAG: tetratricopeptide repeat protein, partial [Rhodothermaceae bacterium]|nr:tetratricopeptide repeat protein [Rhodothermaceae bacterium]
HHLGDDEHALAHLQKSLRIREEVANRQSQSTSLIAIGQTQVQLGRTEEALTALHEALDLAKALNVRPHVYRAHEALADAYEAAGDPTKALHHTRQFHAIREEVLGAQTRGRLQTMQIRMESERAVREAEIERLRNTELRETNEQLERALTDLQRAQARLVQSEKLAGLGRLTAGIAHEIKNPLNFVLNFAQLNGELAEDLHAVLLARRTDLPGDLADDLDDGLGVFAANSGKVLDHARRADGIVKSMLGHVRSTGGERRAVDLHQLLDQSIEHVFGSRQGDDRVPVERVYDEEVETVEVVTQSMQRVLVNVLDNARYAVLQQAARAGDGFEPQIVVKTRALPGLVRISVIDNGVGIPAAHCTKVFEPFFTTKPTGEGTGLGLSLSYDIVTQGHDGSMVAISDEGQGATFSITLPVSIGGDGAG